MKLLHENAGLELNLTPVINKMNQAPIYCTFEREESLYVVELERKVHTLQTEATISAQLNLLQRVANGLSVKIPN